MSNWGGMWIIDDDGEEIPRDWPKGDAPPEARGSDEEVRARWMTLKRHFHARHGRKPQSFPARCECE